MYIYIYIWGNIVWIGCDYPGTVTKVACPLCGLKHLGSVQARLIQCQMWWDDFRREHCAAWGEWEPVAQRWWSQVSEEVLNHAATELAYAYPPRLSMLSPWNNATIGGDVQPT